MTYIIQGHNAGTGEYHYKMVFYESDINIWIRHYHERGFTTKVYYEKQ